MLFQLPCKSALSTARLSPISILHGALSSSLARHQQQFPHWLCPSHHVRYESSPAGSPRPLIFRIITRILPYFPELETRAAVLLVQYPATLGRTARSHYTATKAVNQLLSARSNSHLLQTFWDLLSELYEPLWPCPVVS